MSLRENLLKSPAEETGRKDMVVELVIVTGRM
jgi:hypothetical protein